MTYVSYKHNIEKNKERKKVVNIQNVNHLGFRHKELNAHNYFWARVKDTVNCIGNVEVLTLVES